MMAAHSFVHPEANHRSKRGWLCALTIVATMPSMWACEGDAPPVAHDAATHDATEPDAFGFVRPGSTAERLDPRRLLIRMSLDLQGLRPAPEDFEVLRNSNDPAAALAALREDYLASPHFEKRVRDLWAPVLRTRTDEMPVSAASLDIAPEDVAQFAASVGEEPLRLLGHIAANDLPLTLVATADYTFVDDRLARIYPTDYPDGANDWRMAHYTDGRPHAGWLSMNGMWWRYLSDGISHGRGRANAIARILLCSDFLDRPVDFPRDIDLTDESAIRVAIRENRGCIGCHASLDPLASYLAGFQYAARTSSEIVRYAPARERQWPQFAGLAPAFYGTPGFSLRDLGQQVAADPRFIACWVERGREMLVGPHDPRDADAIDALTLHREALLAGGVTLKALFRSIVAEPAYADAARTRLLSPEQWSATLKALTGYESRVDGVDLFATDRGGLRTLAGGADGRTGAGLATVPTVPMTLTWERTAEAAALFALNAPEGTPGAALVAIELRDVRPDGAAVDDARMRQVVAHLHARLFGTDVPAEANRPEIAETLRLWDAALAVEDDPRRAWAAVVTAMLLDPTILMY
jgi:hypothetical protein